MFDLNLGRVGLNPRPDFQPGQEARPLDLVSHAASLWVCTSPTQDAPADGHPSWMSAGQAGAGLIPLRDNLTVFVREDGDDANSGLENSPGGAFKTPQRALNMLAGAYFLGPYNATVSIGPGTFPHIACPAYLTESGVITIQGAGPETVIAAADRQAAVFLDYARGQYIFRNFTVSMTVNVASGVTRHGILCRSGSLLYLHGIRFHIRENADNGDRVVALFCRGGEVSLQKNNSFDLEAMDGGSRIVMLQSTQSGYLSMGYDIAVSGSVDISLVASDGGIFYRSGGYPVFTGSLTGGRRYQVERFAVCRTQRGGENFFPGTVAGTMDADGRYS